MKLRDKIFACRMLLAFIADYKYVDIIGYDSRCLKWHDTYSVKETKND